MSLNKSDISVQKIPTQQRDRSGLELVIDSEERDSLSVIQDEIRFTIGDQPSKPDSSKLMGNKQKINGLQPVHLLKMVQQDQNMVYNNQNLNEVPKQITAAQFKQVTLLDLSHNFIVEITESLCQSLPNLQQVILSNNKLDYITPSIQNLRQLILLKLNSNNLKCLPNEIGELKSLQHLDVSDNQLYCVPDTINQLEGTLKYLNLAHNQIKTLPPEIGALYNLQSLFIENNHFVAFPTSLRDLVKLKEFALDWFKYLNPPLPQLIQNSIGEAVLEMLRNLCKQSMKKERYDVSFVEFIQFFSEQQFDVNQIDNRNRTLIHNASCNGDLGVLKSLIRSGADLNILDKDECTPLCVAIRECQFEAARSLIEAGADVNKGGGVYGSALHLSIVRTNLLLTDMMIKRGAEVNVVDSDGNTPLHFIMNVFSKSESKYRAIAECLVLSGAKTNCKNQELWTPIHIASRKGQIEGIRWAKMTNEILKEMNLDIFDFNMPGGAQRWTPLHLAGYSGHSKIVEEILSGTAEQLKKFPINVYARNCDYKTPRQCTKGNLVLTKIFRKAEKRYLKEVFEVNQINEVEIIHSRQLVSNLKEEKFDDNYISLLTDYKKIKFKNDCQISLKAHAFQHQMKKYEPSIRLEQSRIFDQDDLYENEDEGIGGLGQKNKPSKKFSLNIDSNNDKPKTLLQELMENMSPRSVNLKLQFFKGVKTIATGNGLQGIQKSTFMQNVNSDINLITQNKNSNINLYYLKDKVLENQILHEKYEALSLIQQNQNHLHFEQMMKLLIEKLHVLIQDLKFQSIVNEITNVIISSQKVELIELLIKKLKLNVQTNPINDYLISLDDLIQDLINAKLMAIVTKKRQEQRQNQKPQKSQQLSSNKKATLDLSKRHPQLFQASVQPGLSLQTTHPKSSQSQLFSMKQAASLVGHQGNQLQNIDANYQQDKSGKITYKINETSKIPQRANNYFGNDDLL